MAITTHSARITGPIPYRSRSGAEHLIPLGPCLVEQLDDLSIDIIWGEQGHRSAALPREEIEAAQDCGNLLLLD